MKFSDGHLITLDLWSVLYCRLNHATFSFAALETAFRVSQVKRELDMYVSYNDTCQSRQERMLHTFSSQNMGGRFDRRLRREDLTLHLETSKMRSMLLRLGVMMHNN